MSKVTAKEKVIVAAQQLMTGRGYSATTVDEIVGTAGVAKGSFYHAFKSKEELAITALEDYERKGWDIVANGPYKNEPDPVRRAILFIEFIELKATELWEHGCLLGSMSMEVADLHPALHQRIDELFEEFEDGLARVFGLHAGIKSAQHRRCHRQGSRPAYARRHRRRDHHRKIAPQAEAPG